MRIYLKGDRVIEDVSQEEIDIISNVLANTSLAPETHFITIRSGDCGNKIVLMINVHEIQYIK